jgi:hypothetical protein
VVEIQHPSVSVVVFADLVLAKYLGRELKIKKNERVT